METLDRNSDQLSYSKKRALDPSLNAPCRSFADCIEPAVDLSKMRRTPLQRLAISFPKFDEATLLNVLKESKNDYVVATMKLAGEATGSSTGKRKRPSSPTMSPPASPVPHPPVPEASSLESDQTDEEFVDQIVNRMTQLDSLEKAKMLLLSALKQRTGDAKK